MSDATLPPQALPDIPAADRLAGRRLAFAILNLASMAGLSVAMALVMQARGWSAASVAFFALFLAGLPWTLMGFWNSAIGFVILRLVHDPVTFTNPALRRVRPGAPISSRTAICLALRHEAVGPVFDRLAGMVQDIVASGWADRFAFHVLSDSVRPASVAAEEAAFAALCRRFPAPGLLHYRRRADNAGFKAGNLMEFAGRSVVSYDHMIVLDADSWMSDAAMLRLVRAMEANPQLGILQTLVTGRPSGSAFTRVFQFGMRHAMRTQTVGSAWWQGASGPFWGHNAIVRLKPFVAHCLMPVLPGKPPLGGHVLSHDQVEAALMAAAGWEVRVIADECGSSEENPPNLQDFIKRDLRWCQGNLQYLKLFGLRLKPMGRFQLINAIMMYLGAPLGVVMLLAGLTMAVERPAATAGFPAGLAFALYFVMLGIGFAPRLLGMVDVLLRPGGAARYGGRLRLMLGGLVDLLFSLLLGPVMMIAQARFVFGLAFGRRVTWEAQNRAGRAVPVAEALRGLWPQLVFGVAASAVLIRFAPAVLPLAAPTLLPCLLAIPFACFGASRFAGRLFVRLGLCAVPEERDVPALKRAKG